MIAINVFSFLTVVPHIPTSPLCGSQIWDQLLAVAVREGHTPIEQKLLVCKGNCYHMLVCFTKDLCSLVPGLLRLQEKAWARGYIYMVGCHITRCFLKLTPIFLPATLFFFFLTLFSLALAPKSTLPLSSLPLQRLQASARGGTSCRSLSGEEEEEPNQPPSGAFLYLLHLCLRNNRSENFFINSLIPKPLYFH